MNCSVWISVVFVFQKNPSSMIAKQSIIIYAHILLCNALFLFSELEECTTATKKSVALCVL